MSAGRNEDDPSGQVDLELADLLNLVPFDIMLIDEDHRIVIPAEAFEERLGRDAPIVGRPCYQVVHNEPESFPGCPLLLAAERNRPVQLEVTEKVSGRSLISCVYPTRHKSPEGKRLFLHSLMDITALRQAEKDLQDSEERYRILLDNTPDFIFALDTEGRLTAANRSFAEVMNVTTAHILGKRISDWPGPAADAERTWSALHQRAMALGQSFEDEICVSVPNQGMHFFEVHSDPIMTGDQLQTGVRFRLRDITQRKKAEEALDERDEQLRQSQKMEAIGQLAGGIAHDFNNLLTVILGDCELMLADEITTGSNRELLLEVTGVAERAAKLTGQILAFSRRQTMQPRIVCLNDALHNMETLLRRTLGEHILLAFRLSPTLGQVKVDPHQLEQVLLNLALNSRDAMPAGGRLTIETADVEFDLPYSHTHPEVQPGPHVMLAVSDTGIGMDPETLTRVFEPFFTTKQPGLGTGLGLSTVFGIIKQSGGSISVYSEPDQGTSFKLYLPTVQAVPPAEGEAPRVEPTIASMAGHETILLVEDEPTVRGLAVRILSQHGYTIIPAANGTEALRLWKEMKKNIDMVVTDVTLPGMQGQELVARLLSSSPHLPVLYMSGYTRNAIADAGRLDGGIDFLEKPFTADALAHMVREVLDSRNGSN